MRFTISRVLKTAVLLVTGVLSIEAAAADRARLVIADVQMPASLSARERGIAQQIAFGAKINDGLAAARSFDVLVRDDAAVQAILREMQIQKTPLARDGKNAKLGLDLPDYILVPTLRRFSVNTTFEKQDLLAGRYERRDTAVMELNVRVIDAGGATVFEKTVTGQPSFEPREASEEEKARATPPPLAPFNAQAARMARAIVDAINVRINPIVVVKVDTASFYILRGSDNGFAEKSRFEVFSPNEKVKVADQDREVTIPGKRIGTAEVIAMYDDVAELRMLDGDLQKVLVNSTVRTVKE